MKHNIFMRVAALLVGGIFASQVLAQNPMLQPLPVDPAVRVGQLPNGLTYYIRHNELPKDQAFFYIAQKVGSIQEEDDQRGLAHFLEHMCFNGTKHFPGNQLITYLESIGVKFGAQLNAYTSIEETVYNINNVPATREATLDSVLLILSDWSHDLLLDGDEIDKERGVIHEEWRMHNVGQMRILEKELPRLMSDSRFGSRLPIGTMDIVDNFPHDALRAYYHKWYRPDLQGIIIVGDIDVNVMEGKVQTLFGAIPAAENPAQRQYLGVPDNTEAIVVSGSDKELTEQAVEIMMKHPAVPDSLRNTLAIYVQNIIQNVGLSILNQRLDEVALKAECPYKEAGVSDGTFLVSSKVTESFNIAVTPKEGQLDAAIQAVLAEVYRAQQYGFTKGEVDRAILNLSSSMEQQFNNRDKQQTISYCREYCRAFLDNEAIPGIETEFQLVKQLAPNLPVEAFNEVFASLVNPTDTNLVVLALTPEKEGLAVPTEQELLAAVHAAQQQPLQAWVDNVKTGPLVTSLPAPGTIKKVKAGPFGSQVLTLSNGVRVVWKQTDFKDDEIRCTAWSPGGTCRYTQADAINLEYLQPVMGETGMGDFRMVELQKALAGKNASVRANVGVRSENISGSSSVKDQRTLFELIYLVFQPRLRDDEAVQSYLVRAREELRNKDLDPSSSLSDSLQCTLYDHHWMVRPSVEADIDEVDYDRILQIWAERFADASDFTFCFIGNIDEDSLRTLACQYLATLPTVKRNDKPTDVGLHFHKGDIINDYTKAMQQPATTFISMWTGPWKFNVKDDAVLSILGQCLDTKYMNKIREEMGAAYTTQAQAMSSIGSDGKPEYILQAVFPIKPETTDSVMLLAQQIFEDLAQNGADAADVAKAKEYMLKTYQQNQRENAYWLRRLSAYLQHGYNNGKDYEAAVSSITPADVQKMAQRILRDGNRARVVMRPEAQP